MPTRARNWPIWAAYGAATWSAFYAVVGVYWSGGGDGFPFGRENDPAADLSIIGWVEADRAAPVTAAIALIGVVVAVLMARGAAWRGLGSAFLGYAWLLAVSLALLIPDYRVLVVTAYTPIILVGSALGLISEMSLADAITWPVVNQFVFIVGGLLWAGTALGYRRSIRGACLVCGRGESDSNWTSPAGATRWGRGGTFVALAIPIVYAITRISWALGIPLGISEDFLREGQEVGLWQFGAALAAMGLIGALLTFGLIRPWGEAFPRWMPFIGGRRVPVALAVVPAGLVALLVTIAGLMFVRLTLTGGLELGDTPLGLGENWAAIAPELLWPIWGVALGAAAVAYYLRRRGICKHCGRGRDDVARRAALPDQTR